MTDLTLKFQFTDRSGAAVYDVIQADEYPDGMPFAETHLGQVRIPPDPRIAELEAENQILRDSKADMLANHIHDKQELEATIERVKALPDQWRRAGSLMIDAERCLTDLEEALEETGGNDG